MSQLKVNSISDSAGANGNAITLATDGSCIVKATNRSSNLIINGDMKIAQRQSSGDVASSGSNIYACVDRWKTQIQTGTVTLSQESTGTSDAPYQKGHRKYLRVKNKTGVDANAAQYIQVEQYIEAQDIAACGWDYRDSNSKITLSFWVRSSIAQKFGGFLVSFDGTQRLHSFEISNNGSNLTADTWTKISKTFGGDSGITIDDDNDMGLRLTFVPFYGTNNTTSDASLTAWGATNTGAWVRDMTTTWATTPNATFDLTGVQLEVGDFASDYCHEPYSETLRKCQRYYWKETQNFYGTQYSNSYKICEIQHPVPMRATPTETMSVGSGTWTHFQESNLGFRAYVNHPLDTGASYFDAAAFDAEL